MKRIVFFAAAVLALAACSKELDVNRGNAIDFRIAGGTRAIDFAVNDVTTLDMYAFEGTALYFHDTFTKQTDYTFTSAQPYYWPATGNLDFYTYKPTLADMGLAAADLTMNGTTKTLAFVAKDAVADQVDFVAVKATGNKNDNESTGLELPFKHTLSQIEIQAKENNANYNFSIKGYRIGNAVNGGTYDFSGTWTPGTTKKTYGESYETAITVGATAASVMGTGKNPMLVPQQLTAWTPATQAISAATGSYLSVLIQINTKEGARYFPTTGDYAWANIPIDTKWDSGKKYIYVLDFSNGAGYDDPGNPIFGQPIKFTVSVVDWANGFDPAEAKEVTM